MTDRPFRKIRTSGIIALWTDESTVKLCGARIRGHFWSKPNPAFQEEKLQAAGGGNVKVWRSSVAVRTGHFMIESTTNSTKYQSKLEEDVCRAV